ncbi:MAG: SusC/RagA family TonB-linked outer membrane protein, partial [Pedobacter sp.]
MRKILSLVGALFLCLFANAQSQAVTGQVKDNLGNPVPFATVRVQNSKSAVSADSAGRFSIEAAQGAILEVSAAGFQNTTFTVGTSAIIEITMENHEALSEVVVTALGIRRNKNELPYAAQQVRGEELTKVRTTNFANALSGKVAGLQIRQNNTMGGSTNIILRGYKSITGENQALVVIDGVPANNSNTNTSAQQNGRGGFDYGNAAADINPDDVESVNVLKGAAATALYGSRAANGVILITTKKGRRGLGVTLNIGGGTGSMDKSTWVKYQHEYGGGYYDPDFYTYSDSPPSPNERFLYIDANGDGVRDLVIPTTEDASFGARFDPNLSVYQ